MERIIKIHKFQGVKRMDVSKMKNMVVLKNLPSNIVDEAFVVLKTNKKAKKYEKAQNIKKVQAQEESKKDKEYVLKEAEMLVSDYILKIENKQKLNNKPTDKKTKKIKMWAFVSTLIAFVEGLIIISS